MIALSAFLDHPDRRSKHCRSRLRRTVQGVIFHLLDEPIPILADPFPRDDPLPGAYELHLPSDSVTIWYTVTSHESQEIVSIQHVRVDT